MALFLYNYAVMYLKKLEIYGFKSFGSKSVLDFEPDCGAAEITAIVGPNGSGKSNVADAIRWVLGEQSNNILRSKKSEDVIFCGSELKSRSSFAEVVITLSQEKEIIIEINNKKHSFPEISVSRRLYRSGESEYFINHKKVRLLDIQETLAFLGFGQSTYTVIGQGMVDRLLFFNAAERKTLFDEAAGIRQYKIKRDQSLKRLVSTESNLIRLNDILKELEPRVVNLRRLVKRAEGRKEIDLQLEALQRKYYGSCFFEIDQKIAQYDQEKTQIEKAIEELRAVIDHNHQRKTNTGEKDSFGKEELACNLELDKLYSDRDKLIREIAYQEGLKVESENQKEAKKQQKKRLDRERTQYEEKETHLCALIGKNQKEIQALEVVVSEVEAKIEKLKQSEKLLELNQIKKSESEQTQAIAMIEDKIGKLESDKAELKEQAFILAKDEERSRKLKADQEQLSNQKEASLRQINEVEEKQAETMRKKNNLKREIDQLEELIKIIVQNIKSTEEEILKTSDHISEKNLKEVEDTLIKLEREKESLFQVFSSTDKVKATTTFDLFSRLFSKAMDQIKRLTDSLDARKRGEKESKLNNLRQEMDHQKEALTDLILAFGKLSSDIDNFENKQIELTDLINNLEGELKSLSLELAKKDGPGRIEVISGKIQSIEKELILLERDKKPYLDNDLEIQKNYLTKKNEIQKNISDLNQELYHENLLLARTKNILENQQKEKELSVEKLVEIGQDLSTHFGSENNTVQIQDSSQQKEKLEQVEGQIKDYKDKLDKIYLKKKETEAEDRKAEQEAHQYESKVVEFSKKLNEVIMSLSHYQTKKESLNEEVGSLNKFNDSKMAPAVLSQEEKDLLKAKIENLKRKKEIIGGVDPETISEFEELDQRETVMRQQVNDLVVAKSDLEKIIQELDQKIKNKFTQTFSEIAKQFNYYFSVLFNGGSSKLEFGEDDQNNLGVEISASPPGKKVQSLNVLSGGERTLTSLALLFAILSVNPSPFCVLDEVDAALDESNTIRFLNILKKLKAKTQFIVITHNRETMNVANLLYGVTMAENHISKLISVQLQDAKEMSHAEH